MFTAIEEKDINEGAEVDFYLKPSDKVPTMKTFITGTDYDDRGRIYIKVSGIESWYPPYHFAKSTTTIRYGCEVTNPLDELHALKGF